MERLDAADLARVGRFVAETAEIDGDEPFPRSFLAALRRLVPCDFVAFNELDRIRELQLNYLEDPLGASDGLEAPISYWQARGGPPALPLPRDDRRLARVPALGLRDRS